MTTLNAKNFKLEDKAVVSNDDYGNCLFDRFYSEADDAFLEVFTNKDGSQSVCFNDRFEFDQETEKDQEGEFINQLYNF